jgi:hypothetical protein
MLCNTPRTSCIYKSTSFLKVAVLVSNYKRELLKARDFPVTKTKYSGLRGHFWKNSLPWYAKELKIVVKQLERIW